MNDDPRDSGSTIGFIGLGNMGAPMCDRLLASGHRIVAFDLDAHKVDHAVANGAEAAASARDCAGRADILLTSLPRPDHVDAVMRAGGALDALRPGCLWVDLTTTARISSPNSLQRRQIASTWSTRR
jgi:3-hydroxyisobutyrate dehydrogenase-like beta-hydroxyacid dehydrogenase